jgi:broad specificity phosphatase PhoE
MTNHRSLLAALAACLLVATPRPDAIPPTVVLLVRHAEKAAGSGDVPLSADGQGRARALVDVGRGAGVTTIVTTQFQRTKQTAAPLAQALGIVPTVVGAGADIAQHARAVADTIRRRFDGQTVLVVGHSNTIPAIVAALGGTRHRDLCDAEYDALFVVVIGTEGPVRTVRTRFGAPSPAAADCVTMR